MNESASNERPCLSLADLKAIDPHAPAHRKERRFLCPLDACAHVRQDAGHRSLSVNMVSGLWQCFRCGASGRLVEHTQPRSRSQIQRSKLDRMFALTPDALPSDGDADWLSMLEGARPLPGTPGARYLARRGIPEETAVQAGVRFAEHWYGRPAVVFPLRNRQQDIVAAESRYIDGRTPRMRSTGKKSQGVFATPEGLDADPVVIVEAPICALSLASYGVPAVALGGKSAPDWLPSALAFRRVALALDNATDGDDAARKIALPLQSLGATVLRWRSPGAKDWNEILERRGPTALRATVNGLLAMLSGENEQNSSRSNTSTAPGGDQTEVLLDLAARYGWRCLTIQGRTVVEGEPAWRRHVGILTPEEVTSGIRILSGLGLTIQAVEQL